jgi:hypothetical protein
MSILEKLRPSMSILVKNRRNNGEREVGKDDFLEGCAQDGWKEHDGG